MKTYPCPTPWRIPHLSQQSADKQRLNDQLLHGATHYSYLCRCSKWHLTRNLAEELPTYLEAAADDIQRLVALDKGAFRGLVDADVKKTASGRDRIALRHPHLHTRWRYALKSLLQDVGQQLEAAGDPDWRAKARHYEEAIRIRLAECRALRLHNQQLAA